MKTSAKHALLLATVGLGLWWAPSPCLAQSPGELDSEFKTALVWGLNGSKVEQAAVQSDGRIIVVGTLYTSSGPLDQGVARLNLDGSLDTSFKPNLSRTQVQTVLVLPDDRILVGGSFTPTGFDAPRNIARFHSDGTWDTSFNVGTGASGVVMRILRQSDGKILLWGLFNTVAESPRKGMARLNSDGTLDETFAGLPWEIAGVSGASLQSDGKILIWSHGGFWETSTKPLGEVARLNSDGSPDPTFSWLSHWTFLDSVSCLAVQKDDGILIGFHTAQVSGKTFTGAVRLRSDASLDPSFTPVRLPTLPASSPIIDAPNINSIVQQTDGKLLFGGGFKQINNEPHSGVVRVNLDGALDRTFDVGTGPAGLNAYVSSLLLQESGKLLVAGPFTRFNGKGMGGLVRLAAEPPLHFSNPRMVNGQFQSMLINLLKTNVQVETSTDLKTWLPLGAPENGTRTTLTNSEPGVVMRFYRAVTR